MHVSGSFLPYKAFGGKSEKPANFCKLQIISKKKYMFALHSMQENKYMKLLLLQVKVAFKTACF